MPPDHRPADYHRSQEAEEMIGGSIPDLLSELCKAWPRRWDECVQPASWIQCTTLGLRSHTGATVFDC